MFEGTKAIIVVEMVSLGVATSSKLNIGLFSKNLFKFVLRCVKLFEITICFVSN